MTGFLQRLAARGGGTARAGGAPADRARAVVVPDVSSKPLFSALERNAGKDFEIEDIPAPRLQRVGQPGAQANRSDESTQPSRVVVETATSPVDARRATSTDAGADEESAARGKLQRASPSRRHDVEPAAEPQPVEAIARPAGSELHVASRRDAHHARARGASADDVRLQAAEANQDALGARARVVPRAPAPASPDGPNPVSRRAPALGRADIEPLGGDALGSAALRAHAGGPRPPDATPRAHAASPRSAASDSQRTVSADGLLVATKRGARVRARDANDAATASAWREQPPQRLVSVHIGTIEIREAPPPAPAAAPRPASTRSAGFDEFIALRTYAPWRGR